MSSQPVQASSAGYTLGVSAHGAHKRIIDLVGRDKVVLDAGCNRGYLARVFKQNGCRVIGIEQDQQSAREAASWCDSLVIADIEALGGLEVPQGYFDVMLFADILEHLRDPRAVLERFRKYLKPGGRVIVSLPNIARLDVRLNLLFGKFEYADTGILDHTHLRFYTLTTARELLTRSGYAVERVFYTGLADRIGILPGLFAFQFILLGRALPESAL